MEQYKPAASYIVIYAYTLNYEDHKGQIKIGKTSMASRKSISQLPPNCPELQAASRERINDQMKPVNVKYTLLYCELAVRSIVLEDGSTYLDSFGDEDIHNILKKSGYKPIVYEDSGKNSEWYTLNLDTVKAAIEAYKKGYQTIPTRDSDVHPSQNLDSSSIKLREEQENAVVKAISAFTKYNEMLWDCKMRFGKTVTAYELIKRLKVKKVIVITHRPAVEDSWDTDFDKIFKGTNYKFIDKTNESLDGYDSIMDSQNDKILTEYVEFGTPFIYFASIQDLRGSQRVGGNFNKNNAVFDLNWELLIVDEAHEGTATDLGSAVIKALRKEKTKVLSLTGTAYNIRDQFVDENTYTWTYVDEQKIKSEWETKHPGEANPYEDLPAMNILTFDITDKIKDSYRYVTEDSAFNFREFFRVWEGDIEKDFYPIPVGKQKGNFVHEDAVNDFLNLISESSEDTNYPFSTEDYTDMFRHTFWLVPGVDEAAALTALLRKHPFFKNYRIVNVAGDGDKESPIALNLVRDAIKNFDRTITISCGRYTTGITVPEWTAIMMLSGSATTSANSYMQAIFRTQSPGIINGKRKENCYVFDFAPDRALRVIAEAHRMSGGKKQKGDYDREGLGEFINFCPIISVDGTIMRTMDVNEMMRQIKRISVDNAINSGFDDNSIYIHDPLANRTDVDADIIKKLSDVVDPKKRTKKQTDYIVNHHGMTDEEHKKAKKLERKKKKDLTEEEKKLLEKLAEERKARNTLYDLLRAVSIRLPLLFYGADADFDETISIKDLVKLVDDESWTEFMPKGLDKKLFQDISKYYDEDVVVAAGLRIRKLTKAADDYPPAIRARKIVEIIGHFKNPDKETVLTPWRVVNLHMGTTLGGYNFYDEKYEKELGEGETRFIDVEDTTSGLLLNSSAKILEINSKSGLYPLYIAYTLYTYRMAGREIDNSRETLWNLWADILEKNIFVLCKTKMAQSITRRSLVGYTGLNVNTAYFTKLVERMKDEQRFKNKVTNPESWGLSGGRMEFDTIVGNPPYQGENHQQIYPFFYKNAINISSNNVSLIFPTGWQKPKTANNLHHLNCPEIKEDHQIVRINNVQNIFPGISGAEWVNILLWKKGSNNGLNGKQMIYTNGLDPKPTKLVYVEDEISKPKEILQLKEIIEGTSGFIPMADNDYMSKSKPYGLRKDVFRRPEYYNLKPMSESKTADEFVKVYGSKGETRYISSDYNLPRKTKRYNKYKVFVGSAWGNMSEGSGLGGAYSDIIIASPFEICTETYVESGCFDDFETAQKHAKYLMTRFVRALLYAKKISQMSTAAWGAVPVQTYKEDWWNGSIAEIEDQLFKKYNVDNDVVSFVKKNIQKKDESNILNYCGLASLNKK